MSATKNTTTLRITVRLPARTITGRQVAASRPRARTLGWIATAVVGAPALLAVGFLHRTSDSRTTLASSPALIVPAPATPAAPAAVVTPPPALLASDCHQAFDARQWKNAITRCTAAAEADPTSHTMALKVAHALFARDRVGDAGLWADKALTLGSADPDAHVLIGHAARAAGDQARARAAYRAYLKLAPHGWHAARVRVWLNPPAPEAVTDPSATP